MKTTVSLFLLISILAISFSCQKEAILPAPTVNFSTTDTGYGIYQFNITSSNAESYLWNFGDGGTSTLASPKYPYKSNGTFNVSLTAKGKGGETIARNTVTVTTVAGDVTFWMSSGGYSVDVTLDGKYLSTITSNYSTKPNCEAAGTAWFPLQSEGVHSFTAKEKGRLIPNTWKGTVTVKGGQCTTQQLAL
jgi:PKD repeat protein